MSEFPSSRAADLAAQQVESIVAAADAAAERIRAEAEQEREEARRRAVSEADEVRAEVHREAEKELERARREAVRLAEDARREAAALREETRKAVEGRVQAAERAADEVLAEARTISDGLRRLAGTLGSQADGILRDVQAAHRRMQADLRIGPPEQPPARGSREPARGRPPRTDGSQAPPRRGSNPLGDLEVPPWVGRSR